MLKTVALEPGEQRKFEGFTQAVALSDGRIIDADPDLMRGCLEALNAKARAALETILQAKNIIDDAAMDGGYEVPVC
jgi:hypothetical protein